tara:strand:+ start:72 stop:812 length:741 start_codon:yes stop_codon:yes gene_type:complete
MLPEFGSNKFQCPHCRTIATQSWFSLNTASSDANAILQHIFYDYRTGIKDFYQTAISTFLDRTERDFKDSFQHCIPKGFSVATCASCNEISLWVNNQMKYPKTTILPPPNSDLDEDIKELYQEATTIFLDSPKGSTALLRLALQKLLKQVGKSGSNINKDIKDLVSEGLSPKIQQALDLLRVVGNNAVHPGQINLDDNSEIAKKLFNILNFIADELLTKPKELESLYADIIPEETQEHIKQRDKTT